MIEYIIIGIIIVLLIIAVYYYNRLNVLSNIIDNSWAQIDVQLKKRTDLVPNLVETVKGYAAHEKSIFEAVADARARMLSARPTRSPTHVCVPRTTTVGPTRKPLMRANSP